MYRLQNTGFYAGVFIIAGSILCMQILQTRMLSVMSWYFLAFFAISMAMFGMTAGALLVYFFDDFFKKELLRFRLVQFSLGFSVSAVIGWLFLISSLPFTDYDAPIMASLVWLKLIIILAPPYVFGGIVISLVLTRSPYPVGVVYAVDLMGAAAGCFAVLGLMALMDGPSALLAVAASGGISAALFKLGFDADSIDERIQSKLHFVGWPSIITITAVLSLMTWFNAANFPDGGRILFAKIKVQSRNSFDAIYWNSFSRVDVGKSNLDEPFLWGPSPKWKASDVKPIDQRWMKIDGAAGTGMIRFSGDRKELDYLEYDVTNLAYSIRNSGRAAVIGVGGGRDILSAYKFGFESITGVEINPIFIKILTHRYADYNQVASLEGVRFVVDEGRSWFARTKERFDLIQMSLIDTWAATGAGAYSLTENGLYTVEGWKHFVSKLKPNGVFTVSRWFAPTDLGETGRVISLAKATLFALGITEPNQHIFLAVTAHLSTIVVSRSAFSDTDISRLRETSDRLGFNVLFVHDVQPGNPILLAIHNAKSFDELFVQSNELLLDFSPPTDDRPFFFNQLRLSDVIPLLLEKPRGGRARGVVSGNLVATLVLIIIVFVSLTAVFLTIVLPALPVVRRVDLRLTYFGTSYFLLIGLGFMFVEIGLMQRLSIFLGHPIYGLVVALAGIIMATGIGSALSVFMPINKRSGFVILSILTAAYIAGLPLWFPSVVVAFDGAEILVRSAISLTVILPAGILLGFWFPTGMRIVQAIDFRPTPWFWAINGSAGVFASGLAVATGTFVSIDASLWGASICYLVICPIALGLSGMNKKSGGATV